MSTRQRRYSKEELANRGDEIYYRVIHPAVYPQYKNKFVVVDIETNEWEMDDDALTACDRLLARLPDAQTWLVKVGKRAVHHIGGPRWVAIPR